MELDEIYSNFGNIYTSQIVPKLAPFECKRRFIEKKYKTLVISRNIATAIATILFIILQFFRLDMDSAPSDEYLNPCVAVFFIALVISLFLFYKTKNMDYNFRSSVKKNILPVIFALFGDFSLITPSKYSNNINLSSIDLCEIQGLNFFLKAETKRDDDVIEGRYKNSRVQITETTLEHKESRGKHTYTVKDFQGLIIKTKLNKNYLGKTLVIQKDGSYTASKGRLQDVRLEDVEFEKMYNVYSDNQVEVRYLLDLAFMEKIKNARRIFISPAIHFAVVNDIFYMFISSREDYFEIAEISRGMYGADKFRRVCNEFISIFKLIEHLNLTKKAETNNGNG